MKRELKEFVGEKVGEASMAWSEEPNGIFDNTKCERIVNEIMDAFNQKLQEEAKR